MDSRREDFRKYLDRAGVMEALTKVLVSLYEESERPEDALEYVRNHIGGGKNVELEKAKARIAELESEITELTAKAQAPAPPTEEST